MFRSEFTVERVEIAVGNCSSSLMFRMNLWKGVIWRPHKIKATFWKPQTDFYVKWYHNIRNLSSSLIWGRFLSRKSLIYLKCKITGDSVGRFIFKCINLGTIQFVIIKITFQKPFVFLLLSKRTHISKFTEYILIRNNIIVMFLDGHFER